MRTLRSTPGKLLFFFTLLASVPAFSQGYWLRRAGGLTVDEGMDISADGSGNTYATGYYTTSASFGSTTLSAAGVSDVYIAKIDASGNYVWAVSGGGNNSDRGLSIKTDAAGNSYVTGFFYNTANFGSQSITSAGAQDIFIAKYDNAGNCLWAKRAGGSGSDIGNGITVDGSGNVIVTGEFSGTANFGAGSLTSMNGSTDVFTTKLDGSGNFLWCKKGSAHLTDRGIDVACDNSGGIYITGQFSDTITFDQPHNNNMYNAIFVVKYDASGNEQWFRRVGGGTLNVSNSIVCNSSGIFITGDFQGTVTFFGSSNVTLSGTYTNGIFVAKYDASGGLVWDVSESSDSPVTSKSIASDGSGNIYIGGHFKCRFNTLADAYGQGVYNSVGYWDVFGEKLSSSGSRLMARQMGGRQDQLCNGIACDNNGNPVLTGTFNSDIIVPASNNFAGFPSYAGYEYDAVGSITSANYCNDPYYNVYNIIASNGNSDGYIGNPFDPARSTYDIYNRNGMSGCNLDSIPVCIRDNATFNGCGPDSIDACGSAGLNAFNNVIYNLDNDPIGPDFTYQWSNGGTGMATGTSTTGDIILTHTSVDGCFTNSDTMHVTIHPPPPHPLISDNVVVNTNANIPQDIIICGDSVLLSASNVGNNTVTWYGPALPSSGQQSNPVWVDQSGQYTVVVVDTFGCSNANSVQVIIDDPLPPLLPDLVFLPDTDRNDSIVICDSTAIGIFPYDSLTNPTAQFICITDVDTIIWSMTPNVANSNIQTYTDCFSLGITQALIHQTGWYVFTAMIIRESSCGSDTTYVSDSLYVHVNPRPVIPPISLVLTGPNTFCPGDSALLVVSGFNPVEWSDGSTNDSLWVTQSGAYSVSALDSITNSFGCSAYAAATVSIVVNQVQQPVIVSNPSDGVICPNDSVQLVSTGSGNFQWQGANGPVGGNNFSIYVDQPGQYYCIVTDSSGCQLLSNTINIQQYNTPYLLAQPSSVICPGDSVTLTLMTSPLSTIVWQQPLSGNGFTQVVTQPGTYTVNVLSCGILTSTSMVVTFTNVQANISQAPNTPVCVGGTITLTANAGMSSYLWQPGSSTGPTLPVTADGTFTLTTTDSGGCTASDTITVAFQPNPLSAPSVSDTAVCVGQFATLHASGGPSILWYSSTGSALGGGSSYTTGPLMQDTSFYIYTDNGVCRSVPSIINVDVIDCPPLTPNVVTPNGDGVNDYWAPYIPYATGIHVRIYNRWGELIYELNDANTYWDATYYKNGKRVSDGVYYYVANFVDGNHVDGTQSGFVEVFNGPGH